MFVVFADLALALEYETLGLLFRVVVLLVFIVLLLFVATLGLLRETPFLEICGLVEDLLKALDLEVLLLTPAVLLRLIFELFEIVLLLVEVDLLSVETVLALRLIELLSILFDVFLLPYDVLYLFP